MARLFLTHLSLFALVALVGCDCGGDPPATRCDTTDDCAPGQECIDNECMDRTDGGPLDGRTGFDANLDAGTPCFDDDDCGGGICVGGACCPSAEQACGTACCGAAETCFANACVTPGDMCVTTADCEDGEYCEPGLGATGVDGGVGAPDAGRTCLGPAPAAGRCLALPPRCSDMPGAPGCIETCEYNPPVDTLNAVEQWRWGPTATEFPNLTDVWSTPAVGRLYDTNCDGAVDALDPPNVVFVSANSGATCCHCTGASPSRCRNGVLRVLDGKTGAEVWSLRQVEPSSNGFSGVSVALGDVDADGLLDVVAVTGEGRIVALDGNGNVFATSDFQLPERSIGAGFGWGGGLALGDMNGDGEIEVAFGRTLAAIRGGTIQLLFTGTGGQGRWSGNTSLTTQLSFFVDLDEDGQLELLAGRTAYEMDSSTLWDRTDLADGFSAVGDFDGDGAPEAVLVEGGRVRLLAGVDGTDVLSPLALPGSGFGGPPTVADFDGDGLPEIGVAKADFYAMAKPNFAGGALDLVWQAPNHDLSSSVTGSTVFDFEGDGVAEVIYNDECFLWVYDGPTGNIRYATSTLSFTATESSLVADVDGDGHAEIVVIANGADPSGSGWGCNVAPWNMDDPTSMRPGWQPAPGSNVHRGVFVLRDAENSWVGTRTLWNQHAYSVSNICDDRDTACSPPSSYGAIPAMQQRNWELPWLNNFRQNVQDQGIFDAPDATVTLTVQCLDPPVLEAAVRNLGAAILPAGVVVGFYERSGGMDTLLGTGTTSTPLFPGQAGLVAFTAAPGTDPMATFVAKIEIDPMMRTFRECREDNNDSEEATGRCLL